MISISSDQFEVLLPLACEWAKAKERVILEYGVPLSNSQIEDAKRVGVIHPERAKVYVVPQIPIPKHPILKALAETTQLITPATTGLTLRYGIFLHYIFVSHRV